jgi:hypothetical protein
VSTGKSVRIDNLKLRLLEATLKSYIWKHFKMFFAVSAIMTIGFWLTSKLHETSLRTDWQTKLFLVVMYSVGIPLILLLSDFLQNLRIAKLISTKVLLVYRARYELGWSTAKIEFLEDVFETAFKHEIEIRRLKTLLKTEQ